MEAIPQPNLSRDSGAPVSTGTKAAAPAITVDQAVTDPSKLQELIDSLKSDAANALASLKDDLTGKLAAAESDASAGLDALKAAFTSHLVDFNELVSKFNTLVDNLEDKGEAFVKHEEGLFHKIGHEIEDGAESLVTKFKSWFGKTSAPAADATAPASEPTTDSTAQ